MSCWPVDFVNSFFGKILQRNNKHFILGNLGVPGHTHLKGQYHFEETFDNYQQEKISFIFYIFLNTLERYCKLVFSGTLNMAGFAYPRWYYQFVETFCFYLQAENQIHTPWFFGDTVKIRKFILGTLDMSGYTQPK